MHPTPESGRLSLLVLRARYYSSSALRRYKNLNIYSKLLIWATGLFYMSLGTFFILVGPDRIGQTMYDLAQKISHLRFGWLLLAGIIGGDTLFSYMDALTGTLSGHLVSSMHRAHDRGFPIAAGGSLFGSSISFFVLRLLFSRRLRKWSSSSEKWQALETVVAAKGLPLIMLIRASPFPPWVYSNALFASIQAVALWQFFVATFVVFPKIALFVFIGSRLASLSDGEQRNHMDTATKILNVSVSVGGVLMAAIASWVIYRAMQTEIRHLQGIPPEVDELAAEAIEEAEEGSPLLGRSNRFEDALSLDSA
ncbi:Golgi apparatus membrane protein TVP38 [Grifola frondosa]|uniref:Golgi apparatus membrane protein TVP38 n=1 Tax=Grifola frondosa TaxID=5627 RepID=A0A1C7MJM9_GRIFR|nr:Golgi apparatus membrane protein TVP38 [Grifola frondosa]